MTIFQAVHDLNDLDLLSHSVAAKAMDAKADDGGSGNDGDDGDDDSGDDDDDSGDDDDDDDAENEGDDDDDDDDNDDDDDDDNDDDDDDDNDDDDNDAGGDDNALAQPEFSGLWAKCEPSTTAEVAGVAATSFWDPPAATLGSISVGEEPTFSVQSVLDLRSVLEKLG